MNAVAWAYLAYGLMAAGALGIYFALPRGGRINRAAALLFGAIAAGGLLLVLYQGLGDTARPTVIFSVMALLAVLAAARVITHRKPVYSALYFVVVVLATAGLAVMAGAEFLAAALVVVYAGAILVTYVFVIMLAQQSPDDPESLSMVDYDANSREPATAMLAGFVLAATLSGLFIQRKWPIAAAIDEPAGNTVAVGQELLARYAIPVELAGVLLMVAMIGALAIARRHLPADMLPVRPESPPLGEVGKTVEPF